MELENPSVDIPKVFGANSPEANQLAADPDPYKDPETADYVGLAIHCAKGAAVCARPRPSSTAQTTPSPTAVADLLPDEPGGYNGYQVLFGSKYIAPVLGAGTPNLTHNGYAGDRTRPGNLVDENGNEIDGAYLTDYPGFPGFEHQRLADARPTWPTCRRPAFRSPTATSPTSTATTTSPALSGKGEPCYHAPAALGSGSACYVAQAQYYNQAFETFFQRLAADGITPQNTLFVFSSDEGDHEAGANVGRAIQPTPANCDGAIVSGLTVTPDVACTYPAGILRRARRQPDGAARHREVRHDAVLDGGRHRSGDLRDGGSRRRHAGRAQPRARRRRADGEQPVLRQRERDDRQLPGRPDRGGDLAHGERRSRPARRRSPSSPSPTTTSTTAGPAVPAPASIQDTGYAWDHGDYAAEINNNWAGFVGPGVANLGLDGSTPEEGPSSAGPNSGQETSVAEQQPRDLDRRDRHPADDDVPDWPAGRLRP